MQSKNKKPMNAAERRHVEIIKSMPCGVCDAGSPSEAHEIEQGQWFTSIPVCLDCHRGPINGWHGQKAIWKVKKLDELKVLNQTIEKLIGRAA
jgi:hypothetical protein